MKTLQCAVGCNGVLYEVVQATDHEFRIIDRESGSCDYYPFALYADARSVEFFLTIKGARDAAHGMNSDVHGYPTDGDLKWQARL
jgi:hypothetical protein